MPAKDLFLQIYFDPLVNAGNEQDQPRPLDVNKTSKSKNNYSLIFFDNLKGCCKNYYR